MRKSLIAAALAFALVSPGQAEAQSPEGKILIDYVCNLDKTDSFPRFPLNREELLSVSQNVARFTSENNGATLSQDQALFMAGVISALKASVKCPEAFGPD